MAVPKSGVTSFYEGIKPLIKISITYLYRKCGLEIPDSIMSGLSIYCKWLKHRGRNFVQNLGLFFYEKYKTISFVVYTFISNKIFESENKEHILMHIYFFTRLVSPYWFLLLVLNFIFN